MKRGSTIFLRLVVWLIGLFVLALCTFALPVGIITDQTGAYRPILIGLYIPAIPFFFALYKALKLLDYIDNNQAFSELSVNALKAIRSCAIFITGFFAMGLPYIFFVADQDDAPGVVAAALVIVFASTVIATFAAVLRKLVQNGVEIKSENDLTV